MDYFPLLSPPEREMANYRKQNNLLRVLKKEVKLSLCQGFQCEQEIPKAKHSEEQHENKKTDSRPHKNKFDYND
jgi:hypothetical protein